jgi:choline dehydrogenase-like flavoprotein
VAAFAEVLIPLDADNPEMEQLLARLEDHLGHMTKDTFVAWRLCIWMFELLAFFYYGKMKRMSRMDPVLRDRYLLAWHHTRWSMKRMAKRFVEAIIFMNYYSLPEVEKRVGFEPRFHPATGGRDFPSENLIREFPEKDLVEEVDVCVIGSGAGGAIAAMRLAKAGRSVVVIEEGPYADVNDFHGDALTMTKKLYRAGGLVNSFGWPTILIPVGRCVGGTTVINSGTSFRTPPKVFQWWVDRFGLTNWSPDRLAKYFDEVEQLLEVAPAEEAVQSQSGRVFSRGAQTLGLTIEPITRNAPGCAGSGVCCFGCPTNAKKSMQLNAVPMAMQAGARVYAKCRAERIVTMRRHASEVRCRFIDPVSRAKGPELIVRAKAVVVACGTLFTPVLLKRSKLPNPSRALGKNLTLHPATKVFALMDEDVQGWKGIPQGFHSESLVEEGIKLEGIFLPPTFAAGTLLLTGREHREAMENYNKLAIFGMMVSDTSRGRVVRGIGGHAVPLYNINREDLPKYQRGITALANAFFAAGALKVFTGIHTLPVVTKEEGAQAIAKLRLRNKDLDLQAFHPLGTCRMGADPREAVVDPNGRLYGLDNLFVADGSIFPTSLGVNPQETIMAASLKIADFIDRECL